MNRKIYPLVALVAFACNVPGLEAVPEDKKAQVINPALGAAVDVVRDEHGIPHIYGDSLGDVAFAQGYLVAHDRLLQMDLLRRVARGTAAELAGKLSAGLVDSDIQMRVHHIGKTADDSWARLAASSDADDQQLAQALTKFAAGVNAYIADLDAGRYDTPTDLLLFYPPGSTTPWQESDSFAVGMLIAFNLSYGGDDEIDLTATELAGELQFNNSSDANLSARRGIGGDFTSLSPAFPTYTLPGDFSTIKPLGAGGAALKLAARRAPVLERRDAVDDAADRRRLQLILSTYEAVKGLGNDHRQQREFGSNDWVVGPKLTKNGHVLVANDPHLSLSNPPIFYMVHLVVRNEATPFEVFGAQFPGAPGIILGANRRVAWGSTTSNLDVTDVYDETVVDCEPAGAVKCVVWKGTRVPLVARQERFGVGAPGRGVLETVEVTLWDVPHHGPILPRLGADHQPAALGGREMSVRWTGHEPNSLLSALLGLNRARSVAEAATALERNFTVGGQNWVLGDVDGHFGWTQAVRVPRRPAGTQPWRVVSGDGSADWLDDLSQDWVPHAFDPDAGYLATANADPVGVTADTEPFATEPVVDGLPLYIGWAFDPGSRVARISERLETLKQRGGITADDLMAIQNDHVSLWNRALLPTLSAALEALAEETATPGTHASLTALVAGAQPGSLALVADAAARVKKWDGDSAVDSVPASIVNVWQSYFAREAFGDELTVLGKDVASSQQLKLLMRMCTAPDRMITQPTSTGDNILFDDLRTAGVVESKGDIAARAALLALDQLRAKLGEDAAAWRWGALHTLTLSPLVPIDALRVPQTSEGGFEHGWPRPGSTGTVDVASFGVSVDDFSYGSGPVQRAVYEVDPTIMRGHNSLPGGEVLDPSSPHFRDLADEYWRNIRFEMFFAEGDVIRAALREQLIHGGGRMRLLPR